MQVRGIYASYANSLAKEINDREPDFPRDIVIVGANWIQIIEWSSRSKVDFIDWHIENRFTPRIDKGGPIDQIDVILEEIEDGARRRRLTDRMLKKIAILNVARKGYALFDENEVSVIEKRQWGEIIKHPLYLPLVYHVTHDYKI